MRGFAGITCLCLLCVALAACGGSGSSATSDRQQIANVFPTAFAAMARGDYSTACSYFSAGEQAKVVAGAKQAGLKASTCAETFTALIDRYHVTKAQLAQTFTNGRVGMVHSISIHGDKATATFTDTSGGKTYTETDALVREGGKWKADHIVKRSQSG